jgi:hypothetical protein
MKKFEREYINNNPEEAPARGHHVKGTICARCNSRSQWKSRFGFQYQFCSSCLKTVPSYVENYLRGSVSPTRWLDASEQYRDRCLTEKQLLLLAEGDRRCRNRNLSEGRFKAILGGLANG